MPIIKCSSCEKEYDITSDLEGKKVKCSKCGNTFEVSFLENENTKEEVDIKKVKIEEDENMIIEEEIIKSETEVNKSEENLVIKPHKMSYILLGSPVLLFGIIALIALFVSLSVGIFFLILTTLIYLWFNVKYKKEEYIVTDRKIIFNYGNLFSDNSIEVNLDKVTQVGSILGFIQYKVFGTGNLRIKTAGSDSSKINFKNINSTMDVYENLQSRMRKNGFHLLKDKLVQSAKPHWLGIIGEMFGKVLINFIIVILVLGDLITELSSSDLEAVSSFAAIPVILFIVITTLIVIVNYLDLRRRKYDIYTDSIFYTEGFLTKHFSFLPMESVSDTENTQSFFSKIFGLHDVIVSSEGSNNKVVFKNMLGGEQMMKNVKYLKDNIIMGEKDILEGEKKSANSLIGFKDKIEKPLDYDKDFKGEYKMNWLKSMIIIAPLIFIPPVFVIALIAQIIRVKFTTFGVEEASIEKKFEFFSKKHNSFSVEKITGVIIKESLLDKILGTCSVSFWSIGSSSNITFSNIKKIDGLEKNILAKVGIKIEKDKKDISIDFNLINYLKSSILYTIVFGILFIIALISFIFIPAVGQYLFGFIGLFIPFFIINYIYKVFLYKKFRYIQKLADDYIESISGIIFVEKNYILIRNIKGIKSIKYPLTNTGTFIFNVAGEQIAQTKGKQGLSVMSNKVKVPYASNVFDKHIYFDNILNEDKINLDVTSTAKQDIGNSIFGFIIVIVIFALLSLAYNVFAIIGVLILGGITIGLLIWSIKVKYYNFEKDRVLFGSGIIYKRKHSILYNKFNFIEKNQGFVNKIFKNGVVKIYTLGSGKVEMLLKDIDNFKDIYELLKKD